MTKTVGETIEEETGMVATTTAEGTRTGTGDDDGALEWAAKIVTIPVLLFDVSLAGLRFGGNNCRAHSRGAFGQQNAFKDMDELRNLYGTSGMNYEILSLR